ncbi:hypothetical protein [Paracoccus sp. IB05]|uniref:hypothetical protein n=1 Tax=Paracoccus sp. IB05 TaxID=2779367 RepID=UPI0018E712D6|nr:hypothetical protein [Paracoccus sp. IB05]MBJ2151460.1 hypothetical protein [Paracoccus sp. IB05]
MLPGRAGPDIRKALAKLNLGAEADLPARHLSKGQAQRVALLLAVAIRPHLLLLAAAASGLDEETWGLVTAMIAELRAETRFAPVEISHDPQRLFAPVSRNLALSPAPAGPAAA